MKATAEQHIVYAVDSAHERHRLTDPLPWGEAQDRWNRLDQSYGLTRALHSLTRETPPPCSIDGRAILFFAVRSEDDPEWPWWLPQRELSLEAQEVCI